MDIKTAKGVVASLLTFVVLVLAGPQPAPAAPGAAALLPSGEVVCIFEFRHGILVGERCIALRPLWPDCIWCDAIAVDYRTEVFVHDRFVDGFVQLDKAAHAIDPAGKAAYRKAALDRFMTVAKATSGGIVRGVGYTDRRTGGFVSEPRPWLQAAGLDIDAGLGWLRVGASDPDGDPVLPIEKGMHHLEQAYQRMAAGR